MTAFLTNNTEPNGHDVLIAILVGILIYILYYIFS